MSDYPTPPGRRRFGAAAFIAALAVAMAGFGGLLLPRMASDGMPAIMHASPNDPVVVRREPRRSCKLRHVENPAERPVFISPADR
jgi:hypothetical protein